MFMAAPPQGPVAESCVGLSVSTLWSREGRGGVTCCTIYGYSDKGTDVLDVSQVGERVTTRSCVRTQRVVDALLHSGRVSNIPAACQLHLK